MNAAIKNFLTAAGTGFGGGAVLAAIVCAATEASGLQWLAVPISGVIAASATVEHFEVTTPFLSALGYGDPVQQVTATATGVSA